MSLWHHQARRALSLAGRLDRLNEALQGLRQRLREAVATTLGSAVADAVRDVVRDLLGAAQTPAPGGLPRRDPYRHEPDVDDPYRGGPDGGWWQEDEEVPAAQGHHPTPANPAPAPMPAGSRCRHALGVAARAALWWLRERGGRRPALTAALVAVAAGTAAFVAGPSLAAGAGVVASVAGLVLTADAAASAAGLLAALASG